MIIKNNNKFKNAHDYTNINYKKTYERGDTLRTYTFQGLEEKKCKH